MKIQLDNWKVKNLSFSAINDEKRKDNAFSLNTGNFFPEDEPNKFGVIFNIEIKDKSFDLNFESVFIFSLNNEITEEFKVSDFPKINAPAIAFPYLRAYISNLTLQSGFQPIILPSINFVALAKEN